MRPHSEGSATIPGSSSAAVERDDGTTVGDLTDRGRLDLTGISTSRRRRRPSGEPPALPRQLQSTGRYWLLAAGLVMLILTLVALTNTGAWIDRSDAAFLRGLASIRSGFLTSVMRGVHALSSAWTIGILRWGTLLTLLLFKRFRHFFVFLGAILTVGWVTTELSLIFTRARPVGVEILGHWQGSSMPSRPVATLAATLIGISYSLVPPGRPRTVAKWTSALLIGALAIARLYLAVDHPTDVIFAAILGIAIPLVAFRYYCPNESFPVTYRRGRAAHLDIGGARGKAIHRALEDQLGISVVSMEPVGLAGSGGSTPLRLCVDGEPNTYLFAKLYAQTHLRADRWYKLGRTLLYGRLEDEGSFSTVRRLVQYEDYMLRVMRDGGLHVPEPYGFAEITPEREYLLVTGFVEGGKELLETEVTNAVIDDALATVRALWDAGIAHRDIKPSNILVANGKVHLIDVAFGEVRPSPWRQAVDLANMMLVLALRSDADLVYERALRFFTSDEIAEAFAATRGVTMPSQSRNMLRKDRRDLVARFRELAPHRHPIAIQRWSWRRVGATVGVLAVTLIAVITILTNLPGAGLLPAPQGTQASYTVAIKPPICDRFQGEQLILETQSVPSASLVPCLKTLPAGWYFGGMAVHDGSTRFYLNTNVMGMHAVEVTLSGHCDTSRVTEIPAQPGVRAFTRIGPVPTDGSPPKHITYYVFAGGCVTDRFLLGSGGGAASPEEASLSLGLNSRGDIASNYLKNTGLKL
ncbi:MAG: glycosyltransferase 2 family protein [Actinomycetota bacterium]|jgi:tRNA A-37 threonylcarbamoyl transferase component Bud32/membrane-associated phospholipid phosphatase|nr:glycosyltransferase 2 family protein [Actinomycetota bacterium]